MQVILLERVAKLGYMGEVVDVKPGYARNFLLPKGKALRATEANRKNFDAMKAQLEARNLELKKDAEAVAAELDGTSYTLIRQAGETGQLYGSVSARDLSDAITAARITVSRAMIQLDTPIKAIGLHKVIVSLHPEVEATITVNVARSAGEAERQAHGEDLTQRADEPTFETFNPEEFGDAEA
ncbi:50S ribosomal protein L9 [Phreatobacter sp.]|uniref:50S ribosomal protein L9 n=1 Tax=Phreatobacter sp. TaxID=1966341 RepID=UPI0022CD1018|nr:50S ribosomal protein L9 [Phreatobacter sp.]MCZ8315262.1 50S ribosomal protein L9 [Phreatobacter sp.]